MIDNDFWIGKNVLITGHTGFKGSWLCMFLNHLGAKISGLSLIQPASNPDMFSILEIDRFVNDQRGDIISSNFCSNTISKLSPEIIFHLAAARFSTSTKVIVVVTSDKCYENIEKDYAYIENDSLGGYDPYSSSKACSEHVSSAYYHSYFKDKGVGLATVRAGNVIGGGDWSNDRLIPDAVKKWSRKEKLKIRYPNAIRPWQHVIDPLSGYLNLAENIFNSPHEFSGAWNFGPDHRNINNVKVIIELASQIWGDSAKWEPFEAKHLHEANNLQLNSEKSQSQLGWKPVIDFDDAVSKTINWYKEYYSGNNDMITFTRNQLMELQV